ncbi:hypothetical protein Hte_009221 [Hypoxylon texense]
MFFKTVLSGLFFGALATASLLPPSLRALLQPRDVDACAADKSAGYCTTLTYTDLTGAASSSSSSSSSSPIPTQEQCQAACRSVLSDAGDWGVDFHGRPAGYRDEMVLADCGFGVSRQSDADTSQFSFYVHNQDILDVIDESVRRFAGEHGGRVKAEGTMECSGYVVKWYVG